MTPAHRKVAVVGTSNSIKKTGWFPVAKAMQSDHALSFQNFSIGGCTSILAAHALYRFRLLRDHDVIAFDFFVNDMMAIQPGHITLDHVIAYYAALIRDLCLHNAIHKALVLMFPVRDACGQPEQRELFDPLIRLFDHYGLRYIDFDTELQNWASRENRPIADAFEDPHHFAPAFVPHVAKTISDALSRLPSVPVSLPQSVCIPQISLDCMTIAPTPKPQRIQTSLMGFDVLTWPDGASFDLSGCAYLVGVFHWHHETSSALIFHGSTVKRRFILRRAWHKMFRCDALANAVEVLGSLSVTVHNDKSVPRERHLGIKNSVYDSDGSTADIVAFIGCNVDPASYGQHIAASLPDTPSLPSEIQPIATPVKGPRGLARFFRREIPQ